MVSPPGYRGLTFLKTCNLMVTTCNRGPGLVQLVGIDRFQFLPMKIFRAKRTAKNCALFPRAEKPVLEFLS